MQDNYDEYLDKKIKQEMQSNTAYICAESGRDWLFTDPKAILEWLIAHRY